MEDWRVIGKNLTRVDTAEKVTGKAQYAFDMKLPGMLHAKVFRSSLPHARIVSIDTSRAERLPGVKAVVTGREYPNAWQGAWLQDQRVYAVDTVRYIGDPLGALAAVSEDVAEEAVDLVKVEYEPLPAIFDPVEAMAEGATLIHPDLHTYKWPQTTIFPVKGTNICNHFKLRKGDVDRAFDEAEYVFEDTFKSPMIQHCHLEPHVSIVDVDSSGRVTVWSSTQGPYMVRQILSGTFGLPVSRIRVITPYLGGGFGAKSSVKTEPLVLPLALKTGKPVRLSMTREEEFTAMLNRIAMDATLKTGVSKDGRLLAKETTLIWDAGGYSEYGVLICRNAGYSSAGPYVVPNVKTDSYCVYTNKTIGGPMRGFGIPEITWAIENQMDIIAEKLGIDPLELRLINGVENESISATGQVLYGVGLKETLKKAAEAIDWGKPAAGKARGKGIACMHKGTVSPTASGVSMKLNEDGTLTVLQSGVEMGQGAFTALSQIAAEELTLPLESIVFYRSPDTDVTPYDWQSAASRAVFMMGNAIRNGASEIKKKLFEIGAEYFEVSENDLILKDGKVCPKDVADRGVPLAQIAMGIRKPNGQWLGGPIAATANYVTEDATYLDRETGQGAKPTVFWMYATQAAEVEVDTETGKVEVLRMAAAHDVGKAINPDICNQQIEGSLVTGLGTALFEQIITKEGRVLNPSFVDYKLPTATDTPEMVPILVEEPHPEGPYGAKGIGEPGLAPTAPAIANAIYDAVGVRIRDLPITQEKVLWALKEKKEANKQPK